MHFTASPATYFTAAYERILFTKLSLLALLFICCRATAVTSVAQALARWKMLMCSNAGCARARDGLQRNNRSAFRFEQRVG
jgi:hypothetical protein